MSAFTLLQITRNHEQYVSPTRQTTYSKGWDSQSTLSTAASEKTVVATSPTTEKEKAATTEQIEGKRSISQNVKDVKKKQA
jgi:hypothetical protein